jgi:hypothetical protein
MNKPTSRSDYAIRLERVFEWLADHLDDTLDLTRLAALAHRGDYQLVRSDKSRNLSSPN